MTSKPVSTGIGSAIVQEEDVANQQAPMETKQLEETKNEEVDNEKETEAAKNQSGSKAIVFQKPTFKSSIVPQSSFHTINARKRFLYKPFVPLPNLADCVNQQIEVRVDKSFLTKQNKAFLKKQFWGTDTYTSESDVVCILQHQGFIGVEDEQPHDFEGISVYFRVVKGKNNFNSSFKNGIRSQKSAQFEGHGIKYERSEHLPSMGSLAELTQMAGAMPFAQSKNQTSQRKNILKARYIRPDLGQKIVVPSIIFNLSFEPAQTYNLGHFTDQGDEILKRTSNKLNNSVLYIETSSERYEISRQQSTKENQAEPRYKLAKVKNPKGQDIKYMKSAKLPLEDVEVVFKDLDWSEFEWGEASVLVKKKVDLRGLKSFKFFDLN